jgi:hypothetical protein
VPKSRGRKKPRSVAPPGESAPAAPESNPSWWVPVMVSLMVAGLAWVVTTYISETRWPVPVLGSWNLAVGFGLILAGFGMTMRWR